MVNPGASEPEPEDAVLALELGPARSSPKDVDLLAKGKILHHQTGSGREDRSEDRDDGSEDEHHHLV
jgi:hypothetical protein